jgi:hypothetical protein
MQIEEGVWHAWGRKETDTEIWFGKPRGWGPLATGRRRFEDNIKVILKDMGMGGVE